MRVGVVGAPGRMGSEACRAVLGDDELELVARIGRTDSLDLLVEAEADVAVDFTTPSAVLANVRFYLSHGIHAVVGTSGLTPADLSDIAARARAGQANAFVAPNFAVGAVLMMSFAARAARHFARAEIVERHHDRKVDAPSATALRTAALMNEARGAPWPDASPSKETLAASRGGISGGVRIHSLRLPGSVAHQEVLLGAPGETLVLRHDSLDRSSFMPGVLLAVKRVAFLDGLTVGLEQLLDL